MRDVEPNASQKSVKAEVTARSSAFKKMGAARSERFLRHSARKSAEAPAFPASHSFMSSTSCCRSCATAEYDSATQTTTRIAESAVIARLTSASVFLGEVYLLNAER